jgi:2-hydroxycyclohexanecarboxyl-CoA dehydrogenase
MFDLSGSVAIVTGAGQGVGREIAMTLARNNAAVAVNDVRTDRAQSVVDEITAQRTKAVVATADVTDYTAVQEMVAHVTAALGPVSVLVNNAGNAGADPSAVQQGAFWELEPAGWDRFVSVNLYGPMNCVRAVLPGMVERQDGRILTIISDAGRTGEPGLEAYSAAKAGAAGFTRAIARAVGRYGITANNIAIATTQTPTTQEALDDPQLTKKMMSRYVIRRPGQPTDIAPAALLLCSPESSWMTGQTVPVNGGFSFNL